MPNPKHSCRAKVSCAGRRSSITGTVSTVENTRRSVGCDFPTAGSVVSSHTRQEAGPQCWRTYQSKRKSGAQWRLCPDRWLVNHGPQAAPGAGFVHSLTGVQPYSLFPCVYGCIYDDSRAQHWPQRCHGWRSEGRYCLDLHVNVHGPLFCSSGSPRVHFSSASPVTPDQLNQTLWGDPSDVSVTSPQGKLRLTASHPAPL